MRKFEPKRAFLFKNKLSAQKKAESLRREGFRAELQPASKTTRKRSPSLKWAVFKGQKRKK